MKYHRKDKLSTGVEKCYAGWRPWFQIDNQVFYLSSSATKTRAVYFQRHLKTAFKKLMKKI